ncbi:fatty acid hydroxylase [[Leptolyngbya] sp. PCC 7376]|uniref:sterol desaturase family protein n=1 Tax=[Leptolyngbya] sp. PCC 7376 TaxID=111781 RepID=UPI00029ED633|nr:sterol desaturase family protein [[Leptolyngbya] sp. PCC 7376]AFY39754.1 fatty acid hydroxylase [[Leptolyngbya] sp. PCC 7376]
MATLIHIVVIATFFLLAFLFGSFIEYWIHRVFHVRQSHPIKKVFPKLGKGHTRHHLGGEGQGFLWEFRNYVLGTCPVMIPMFFISLEAGISWASGIVVYAAFAAYAHQLQHDTPIKCVWMSIPVHYVHHKYNQWHHNYGIGVDWWDRIFGTYKSQEWIESQELSQSEATMLAIKWY